MKKMCQLILTKSILFLVGIIWIKRNGFMCIGDFIRRLHFRNEEIHELPENEKRVIEHPPFPSLSFFNFSVYYHSKLHIITETHIQTRKLRAVSVFVSYPPFFNSIFRQTNTPFSQNRQYPTPFYLSVLYYHGNP